ncbi:MAG: hypothetical protein QM784_40365 [Polyangiaceae bacterium]
MKAHAAAPGPGQDVEIDIFCAIVGDAYRVHVRPTWLPDHLLDCFDDEGEAFPVYLDFDDLDWHMKKSGVEYTKRLARSGSVQLYARGAAAHVLSTWLSNSFATGERAI